MQNKLIFYNLVSPLFFQVVNVICGFIVPRLILAYFGSNVNGLVNSICQFLGIISFLELGMGVVVESSLYKPLADKDKTTISRVITSADKFFRTIGYILFAYVLVLIYIFPLFVKEEFDILYTAMLILAISIRYIAQYFFGIVNRLLLVADQKAYIQYNAQTLSIIVNTVFCYILICINSSVQFVYLTTSIIFLIQPFLLHCYVKKVYNIDRNEKYSVEPIKQKWNGIAQHISYIVLEGTDILVLTLFSSMINVSIYSVYLLPLKGVKQLILSITSSVQALIGNLWAKQDFNELLRVFAWTEWLIHTCTILFFTLTAILIVPFVQVYTYGVNDANYIQPLFGVFLVVANLGHCLRLPYNIMILAVGHYKQTQHNYLIATIMNIVISIIGVKQFGLIGVTLGTLVAMLYQTVWMAWYNSKNFIQWPMRKFFKQMSVDAVSAVLIFIATSCFTMNGVSYLEWFFLAIKVTVFGTIVVFFVNYIFYKEFTIKITCKVIRCFR